MIEITTLPKPLLIEKTSSGQHLSLDFFLKNISDQGWEIQQLDLKVFSPDDSLVIQKSLNTNGIRPAIETLGITEVEKDSQICVYNPFDRFPNDLNIAQLVFEFYFGSDSGDQFKNQVVVNPEKFETKTDLRLPMSGPLMVLDGHDFYSHHRRVDLTHPFLSQNMGLETNSGRFAYDFCPVNEKGELHKDKIQSESDWYGFGKPVIAPGAGIVVQVQNEMEDNILGKKDFDFAQAADEPNSIMGNHVVIDHLNGEFSLLAHLQNGSITVAEGTQVEQAQIIGKLGFSGSTGPWVHLHYELRTGIDIQTSRGLPAYFRDFSKHGSKSGSAQRYFDTGEIVENNS